MPYWEEFLYEGEAHVSVAAVLRTLPVEWECGCMLQKCGACAMRINGVPRLACGAFLDELATSAHVVQVEPLSKFPVVRDLVVDRSAIQAVLRQMRLWLEGEPERSAPTREARYQSAKCLQCGCCLEVCPNFSVEGDFAGALSAVNAFRLLDEELKTGDPVHAAAGRTSKGTLSSHGEELAGEYRRHYYAGCGHSLACHNICPIDLPVEELLIRSNAMAVWHKRRKRKG